MPKIAIIGAGISGLALAYRLEQALDAEVVILEQRPRPGGTIGTERRDGFQVEVGPNGFLDNKPTTLALAREIGLTDQLLTASEAAGKNRYLFLDGKLHRLPHSLFSFLGSDLLSWHGKFGMIAERWRRPRAGNGDESIDAFARRRVGPEVADVFADGLVTGIYAGDPKLLSIRACFPRLVAMEEQHGSVLKGFAHAAKQRRADARARGEAPPKPGKLWSFKTGLGGLVETLQDRLRAKLLTGVNVRRVGRTNGEGGGWTIAADGQDQWQADAVVLTCPAYQQAGMLHDLDAKLAERVGAIAYNRVAVIALGYRRSEVASANLDAFGYIAPQRTRRDVLGVQYCSSIYAGRAPEGAVLMRAMVGGWHRAEVAGWDDDRLLATVRAELALVLGIRAEPIFHHIVRWDRAIPQYHLGHLERVSWAETRAAAYPGLFLAGNAYKGVALNDCTEQAEVLAGRLKNFLASPARR